MLVHNNPSITAVSGSYKKRSGSNETLDGGTTITMVMWDEDGILESGLTGVVSKVKISIEQLPGYAPLKNDVITYKSQNYKVNQVSLRNNNPMWDDFWEIKLKSKDVDTNRL